VISFHSFKFFFFHLIIYFNATLQNILTPDSVKKHAFNISRKEEKMVIGLS